MPGRRAGSFSPPGVPVSIFYSPHQDDETVFMGLAIANRVLAGDEVHAVLMTTGENSAAYNLLTGAGGSCSWHGVTHSFSMTRSQFSGYRDVEFQAAAEALGVPTANIHFAASRPADGSLSEAFVETTIAAYEATYPGATHRSMSWRDSHNDHIACGDGLLDMVQASSIDDALFSLRSEYQATYDGTAESAGAEAVAAVRAAIDEYQTYNGTTRFGIGYHSIKTLLDAQDAGPFGETHTRYQNL